MSDSTAIVVHISVQPVAGEATDLESIALSNDLRSRLYSSLSTQQDVRVNSLPTTERSGALLELARNVAQAVYDQRAELTALISTAITVITALGMQRRIDEIEVTVGEQKITVKGVDIDQAQQLIHELIPPGTPSDMVKKPHVTVRTRKRRVP